MQIQRVADLRAPDGAAIPAIVVTPISPRGAVTLVHATGACKEQMLGLALQLGEQRVASIAIDLGGHGQSDAGFGLRVVGEIESAIEYLRPDFASVGCAGVGDGARLALSSSADYILAIAPPTIGIVRSRPQRFDTPFDVAFPEPTTRFLEQVPAINAGDRPCLLVLPEDDMASNVIVRTLEPLLSRAEARFVTTISSPNEHGLPLAWRLIQNHAIVDTASTWLARAAERTQEEVEVHV